MRQGKEKEKEKEEFFSSVHSSGSQSLKSEHRNTRRARHNNNDLHEHRDTGRNGHKDTVIKNSYSNQNTGIQGKPGATTTTFTGIRTQGGTGIGNSEEIQLQE